MLDSFRKYLYKSWNRDPLRAEALARIAVGSLLAFVLAVVDAPSAIPPAFSAMIGIVGVMLTLTMSKLVYILAAAVPTVVCVFAVGMMATSALLAASSISTGLFVALFAVFAFLCCSLFHGNTFAMTSAIAPALLSVTALLSLSLQPFVQNGVAISSEAVPALGDFIATLCDGLNVSTSECSLPETIELQIPADFPGPFAGQVSFVNIVNGTLLAEIPGGLWMVGAFWTERGLENPLAIFQNVLVALMYGVLCLVVAILVPPVRSMRMLQSRLVVPEALKHVVKVAELQKNPALSTKESDILRARGGALWNSVAAGDKANYIIFEPRLCKAPFEYIVPELKGLLVQTDYLLSAANVTMDTVDSSQELSSENNMFLDMSLRLLKASSKSLEERDASSVCHELESESNELEHLAKSCPSRYAYLYDQSRQTAVSTREWFRVLNRDEIERLPTKDKLRNAMKIYLPWVLVPLVPLIQFSHTFVLLTHPKKWSLIPCLHALKTTAGYVLLFSMTVYWGPYSRFAINVDDDVSIGNVYYGWQLCAYAFCSRPTMEGTVKKGLQRIVGTCLGGFLAWLGIIVCSGSYDDQDPINPYGLVTWLLFWTIVASFVGTDSSAQSMQGISHDHGYVGMYFALTMVLIALEVYAGSGSKSDLTANRVVATVTGVAMAMISAVIPPNTRGGSTKPALDYLSALDGALEDTLKATCEDQENFDWASFENTVLSTATGKGKKAQFLFNDASSLQKIPICSVDPRLGHVYDRLALTEALMRRLVHYCLLLAGEDIVEAREGDDAAEVGKAGHEEEEEAHEAVGDRGKAKHTIMDVWVKVIRKRLAEDGATLEQLSN